jgi:hypothetical protein
MQIFWWRFFGGGVWDEAVDGGALGAVVTAGFLIGQRGDLHGWVPGDL